jgi:hypothetical protein
MRFLLLVLCAGLLVPYATTSGSRVASGPSKEAGVQLPPERTNLAQLVRQCEGCHADVHAEWSGTQHAKSWTDPVFQAEVQAFADRGESCARCHAPRALFHQEAGALPVARERDRDLGVNCVTCHMVGNIYMGPYDSQGHGGVEGDPAFRQSTMCFSCHGQPEARRDHDQMTTYLAGPAWTEEGKSCQTCHMPLVERKLVTKETIKMKYLIGVQPARMHTFTGARRGEIVAGCAEVALVFEDEKLVATIRTKTGHSLPCTTHRKVVLTLVQFGSDGEEIAREVGTWVFPDGPVLSPGEPTDANVVEVPVADGAVRAHATLVQILTATEGRPEDIVQPICEATGSR